MGSNKLLVKILDTAPLNGKAWQKKTTFDCLVSIMRIHMDNLSIPDLITVVFIELPLDTTTSFTEVEVIKRNIVSHIYDVTNLCGVSFLTSTGSQSKTPASIGNKYRTKDVAFIWVSCIIGAHDIDKRVQ